MRFMLATEERGIPLVLARAERAESRTKLVDLPAILRPVARALRGDRAVVGRLGLAKQVADRA